MPDFDLRKITESLESLDAKMTLGADGFVDEVWEIVSSRTSPSEYALYSQMKQFADRISNSGTGGVGLELIQKRRAFGGFTANIGYAAARLGVDTAMIGVYGKQNIDPVFEPVNSACRVISLTDPATTHVFEFDDGKILMSHMEAVSGISWDSIVEKVGMEKIKALLAESDMLGVGYWSLLPAFDEILTGFCENLPDDGKPRRFFFDFADFRKRDETSLKNSLNLLRKYNDKVPMTLSVNEHEAAALFAIHNETLDNENRPIEEKTERVRQQIELDELVIHTPHFAAAAAFNEKPALINQVYCEKPKRSAGAGDTFNGGYIAARLAKLSIPECLFVANAAVSFFLKNASAPDRNDLSNEMNKMIP